MNNPRYLRVLRTKPYEKRPLERSLRSEKNVAFILAPYLSLGKISSLYDDQKYLTWVSGPSGPYAVDAHCVKNQKSSVRAENWCVGIFGIGEYAIGCFFPPRLSQTKLEPNTCREDDILRAHACVCGPISTKLGEKMQTGTLPMHKTFQTSSISQDFVRFL